VQFRSTSNFGGEYHESTAIYLVLGKKSLVNH